MVKIMLLFLNSLECFEMIFCDKNVTISGSLPLPNHFFFFFSQMSDFVPAFLTEICDKGNCLNLSHDL